MPFKSKKQQRFMFSKMPELAKEFAEKTNFSKLPEKAKKKKDKHSVDDTNSIDDKNDKLAEAIDMVSIFVCAASKKWYKGKSKISGFGVFAQIDINADDIIGLGFEKTKNTGISDKDYSRTALGSLVNHSKKSNLKILKKDNKFYVIAKKDIPADEANA